MKLGPYRAGQIVVGDCLDVMRQMPDGCVDLVLTDPPYELGKGAWDKLVSWAWLDEARRLLVDGGAIYCFWSCKDIPTIQPEIEKRFDLKNVCVWHYPNGVSPKANDWYAVTWEACLYATKGKGNYNIFRNFSRFAKNNFDVWRIPTPQSQWKAEPKIHPAQKPEALLMRIVGASSNEGNLILDPFMGSGTTAVAADRLCRRFFGCDINKDYVDMALKRLAEDREKRSQLEMPF